MKERSKYIPRHLFNRTNEIDYLVIAPPRTHRLVRVGINRQAGRRPPKVLPLTNRQEIVLAALTDEPRRASAIGRDLGLTTIDTNNTLYVLQRRGLAERLPNERGWKRGLTAR